MMQEANDADVLRHARETAERHGGLAEVSPAAREMVETIEVLIAALAAHQPKPTGEGWNKAWDRFDKGGKDDEVGER